MLIDSYNITKVTKQTSFVATCNVTFPCKNQKQCNMTNELEFIRKQSRIICLLIDDFKPFVFQMNLEPFGCS